MKDPHEPNFGGLKTLVALGEAPSLSSAARALGVPVSTLSRRLQELEASVGVSLAVRTTRSFRLTEAGKRLISEIEGPLSQLEAATARTRDRAGRETTGHLRVATAPSVARFLLPPALARFASRFPGVDVELVVGADPVDLTTSGTHVGVRVGRAAVRDPSLVVRRLVRSRPVAVASPTYLERHGTPARIEDLSAHCVISLARMPSWEFEGDALLLRSRQKLLVSSAEVAHALCLEHAGLALLPGFLAQPDLEKGRLVALPLGKLAAPKDVYLVYSPASRKTPAVREFVNLLLEATRSMR